MVFLMSKKTYPIIGTKSSLLWDEETDAWTYISGRPVEPDDPRAFYKVIPTLFRAVDIRANAIANLPWALMKGETEYETSDTYENKTGLVSNMISMLYLIEASLVLAGSAYWKREQNIAGYDKLRHLDPTSLELDEKKAQSGIIEWKRNENGQPITYTPEEIIYFWYPDPYVEIGPPSSWPVKTTLAADGVLANLDEFAKSYFGRGAIKAMLFSMQGAAPSTAKEFESWWTRTFGGIQNAFRTKVLNAEKVEPVVVGEGIKELENSTLSQEKREEIAVACSIPMSILFADAANYATANQDKRNWYEDKVIPEAKFIAAILNEQVFEPEGLRFVFKAETIDIMQQDEKERSMALGYLFNAEVPLDIAMRVLGFELNDKDWKRIEEQVKEKEERSAAMGDQLLEGGNGGGGVAFQPRDPKDKPDPMQEKGMTIDLGKWQRKAAKRLKGGKSPVVDFESDYIPATLGAAINGALEEANTTDEIAGVFADIWMGYP